MKIQELKIDVIKKILAIDSAEIIEKISEFINDTTENDYSNPPFFDDDAEETQKGIETILKMVSEFK
ncbi:MULTISPECIES: hypothetical protein [Flavobacterium]|uniref:Colicin immunity protein / pyocin immunity protein n=1 Tax=Flavobacterium jumunjinense TaxID=998845 RepID=A0ABV5GMM7_9FLAO|nr:MULTISPECIES: hypothetical protein [Flavobacterium]